MLAGKFENVLLLELKVVEHPAAKVPASAMFAGGIAAGSKLLGT